MLRNCPLIVFCVNVALAVFLTTSGFLVGIASGQKNENNEATTAKAARIALGYEDWGKKYREVREATKKLGENDLGGALLLLDEASSKYPELPPGELIAADWYVSQNRVDLATRLLDQSAQKFPDDPETYLLLGNLAFLENRNTEATLSFEKARKLLEGFSGDSLRSKRLMLRLYAGLSSLAQRFGQWENAVEYLTKWVELDPNNASTRIRHAEALFHIAKGREAYRELVRANQLDKTMMAPAMYIAQFYLDQGDMQSAQMWLESASEKDANDYKPRIALAQFFWNNGDFIRAKNYMQKARTLNKNDQQLNILAGQVAHYDHDYVTAIERFEEIFGAQPDNQTARNHLILALAAEGSDENVARAAQLAEAGGTDVASLVNQCYAFARQGQKDKSEAAMNLSFRGASGPNSKFIFAYVLAENGQPEKALPLLETALKGKGLFVFRRDADKLRAKLITTQSKKKKNAS